MLSNEENVKLFMIEGGVMLQVVKDYIQSVLDLRERKIEALKKLGLDSETTEVWSSNYDGRMVAVTLPRDFKNKADWTKPNSQGRSSPKKGTEAHKIFFDKSLGIKSAESVIIEKLKVPTQLAYSTATGKGFTSIGRMLSSCGFLYMSKDGPYALWIPDVEACVAELKAQNVRYKSFKVLGGTENWKLEVEGLRPILQEEWDLLVAQKNLEEAREKQAKKAFVAAAPAALKKPMPKAVAKAAASVLKKGKK
jgi:hypothetical protein